MTNALVVIRLSRVTDATTSPERQLKACKELCAQRGYNVVGVAEDLDVSAGKTTPFSRPQLGAWLKRPHDFDVIVVFRVDRIVRRLFDLADLIRWCQEHRIALVSATEAFIDLTPASPFGDIIALLVAKVAELELAAISERNRSAAQHNLRAGKYRGGPPPWGYLPQQDEDGRWGYVQDPEQVAVILEVVERVLAGEPLRAIGHDLTERGVKTPRDRFAEVRGREVKGYAFHPGGLKRALTSPTLLGRVVVNEAPKDAHTRAEDLVRDDSGSPVVRAEPILTRDVFDRVGVELAGRENRKEPTVRTTSLLLGVIFCGVCGRAAYKLKGGKGRNPRYRCASAQYKNSCTNRSIPLAYAENELERRILQNLGSFERRRRVWFAGEDHTDELAEVNATLEDLADSIGKPGFTRGTPQRARLDARIEALSVRQAELSAAPTQSAGWRYEPTGVTVAEWWHNATLEERNVWLRQYGFRAVWRSHSEGTRTVVDEFKLDGDLTMDLDADVLFGPMVDIMTALRDADLPDD